MAQENNKELPIESGNKTSLRKKATQEVHPIPGLSENLGVLGDTYSTTFSSTIMALAALAAPLIIYAFVFLVSDAGKYLGHSWISIVTVLIGSILLALNVLFVNPSYGNQLLLSFHYWSDALKGNQKQYQVYPQKFRFSNNDPSKSTLETVYQRHHVYLTVVKAHGSVSKTTFASDKKILQEINRGSLDALGLNSERAVINGIGHPTIKPKIINPNATPHMVARQQEISRGIHSLGTLQTLDTYLVISAPSYPELVQRVNNQFNYFNQGLLVSAQVLHGKKLKDTIHNLLS